MDSQRVGARHTTEFVLVSAVMRPAVTVRATATLREVDCAMLEHDVEAVAVVDGRNNLCGVIPFNSLGTCLPKITLDKRALAEAFFPWRNIEGE